jgi:hypothetical protein
MSRRTSLALLLALAAFGLAGSVGAAPHPAGAARVDLSTKEGVAAYLSSKGLNPASFVVQRGGLNYAGPNCPGRRWNCTKGKKVVQVASGKHGKNRMECGGTLTTTTTGGTTTTTCVVVQTATSGQNHARCALDSRGVSPVVLDCQIQQTNTNGGNFAHVQEHVVQREGADQRATLNASVSQTTAGGDNHSIVNQAIDETSREVAMMAAPTQNQEGRFSASITQSSGTGNNFSRLLQDLDQTGRASGASTTVQRQFGDHFGRVNQTNGAVGGGTTTQGKSKGKRKSSKSETGFSRSRARQTEQQRLRGPGQQTQIGPMDCCSTQLGGDPKKTVVRIKQRSLQSASQATASQSLSITGRCTTVGDCGIRHRAVNNADSIRIRQRCTAPAGGTCSLFVPTTCNQASGCTSGGGGSPEARSRRR